MVGGLWCGDRPVPKITPSANPSPRTLREIHHRQLVSVPRCTGFGRHVAVAAHQERQGRRAAARHVVGARNLPLGQIEERLPAVVKNKALPVVLVCATGARARRAVTMARKLGYDNAQAMAGGLAAWRAASLPVEKT